MSQEQERYPWCKEVVNTDWMVVLTTNCFKVENDFEKIGGENCGSKSNGYEPEY